MYSRAPVVLPFSLNVTSRGVIILVAGRRHPSASDNENISVAGAIEGFQYVVFKICNLAAYAYWKRFPQKHGSGFSRCGKWLAAGFSMTVSR